MNKKEIQEIAKKYPCYNKSVLIIRDSGDRRTASGLIMPDAKIKKGEQGEHSLQIVKQSTGIIVGKGKQCEGEYQIGDRVKFNHFADTEFTHEKYTFVLMHDADIYIGLPSDVIDLSLQTINVKKPDIPRPDFSQLQDDDDEG